MQLDFYEDLNFRERLDVSGTNDTQFNILRDGVSGTADAKITIRTSVDWPLKTFYNLTPVVPSDSRKTFGSSDTEVTGRNNITFKNVLLKTDQ